MQRDLRDIGTPDLKILPTNAGLDIPGFKTQGVGAHNSLMLSAASDPSNFDFDAIFTTYSQLQTIKGQSTQRHHFLYRMAPYCVIIADESHKGAGASLPSEKSWNANKPEKFQSSRALLLRELIALSQGALFLSATFAKNPGAMTLYSTTDMPLAVEGDINRLVHLVSMGGVPLQQSLCTMLCLAGQYLRRERSWEGIEFEVQIQDVDRGLAQIVSEIMGDIMRFDRIKQAAVGQLDNKLSRDAKARIQDNSIGEPGVHSVNFTSILHNLVSQFLLAIKVDAAIEKAVQIIADSAKPILTVNNTMGSSIQRYAEDKNLSPGDAIAIDFGDLLKHYLERSREVLLQDYEGKVTHYRLSDKDLGKRGVRLYNAIEEKIASVDFRKIPLSPIDYIRAELQRRGILCDEITGRTHAIDYTGDVPVYRPRYTNKHQNVEIVKAFNNGVVDALVINRSGSTGISLHASPLFADQRQRCLLIIQNQASIDDAIQLLGRIFRTGQLQPPKYCLLMSDLPIEKRPAALLMQKLGSLNANTTASRAGTGAVLTGLPDFFNSIGDIVCTDIMRSNPDLHEALGEPLRNSEDEEAEGKGIEGAARKVTGRIPLLPTLELQENLYKLIETQYQGLVNHLNAIGESSLEARFCDFQARIIHQEELLPAGRNVDSPFDGPVVKLTLDCKSSRKPYTTQGAIERIEELLHLSSSTSKSREERIVAIREAGSRATLGLNKKLTKSANRYKKKLTKEGKDQFLARFNRQRSHIEKLVTLLSPGQTVEITTPASHFWGIVAEVEWLVGSRSSNNPVALSAWRVRLIVADALREIVVSFGKINLPGANNAIVVLPSPTTWEGTSIWDVFDLRQHVSGREEKTVLTGNLLRAFDKFRGKVINFTLDDNSVCPGLLVGNEVDFKKNLAASPVLLSEDMAIVFVAGRMGIVESVDRYLQIKAGLDNDSFIVEVEKSKSKGGTYYLDSSLLAVVGQFYSVGGLMRSRVRREDLPAVLQAILRKTQLGVFDEEHKKAARYLGNVSIPVITDAPSPYPPVFTCKT
jgi:hypothetical protein